MNVSSRKQIRLQGYDYSQNGAYFITICSFQRLHLFGEVVVGQELCSCLLSNIGVIIDNEISKLEFQFNGVKIDKYIVMPNHVHMIVIIDTLRQDQSLCAGSGVFHPAISAVIQSLKSKTTKQANQSDGVQRRKIWQYRYYDHIIRNETDYQLIWNYIDTNPQRWDKDRYFS